MLFTQEECHRLRIVQMASPLEGLFFPVYPIFYLAGVVKYGKTLQFERCISGAQNPWKGCTIGHDAETNARGLGFMDLEQRLFLEQMRAINHRAPQEMSKLH